jgi:hypothetical protein
MQMTSANAVIFTFGAGSVGDAVVSLVSGF